MFRNKFVIDSHTHVWPDALAPRAIEFMEGYYEMRFGGGGTVAALERNMEESGVDVSIAFSVATKVAQVESINNFLSELQNEKMVTLGTLHPEYGDYKNEVRRIKELGLRGVKFHPDFQSFEIDDIKAMRVYEEIGDSLPIILHVGDEKSDNSSPKRLANVLDQMPYLRVVGAHMGGYKRWDESMRYLVGRDLYLDTSVSIPWLGNEFTKMVREHGVERVLFASDFPAVKQKDELAQYEELGFTEQELELIFAGNAKKLFDV